jgi:hypothetical protein
MRREGMRAMRQLNLTEQQREQMRSLRQAARQSTQAQREELRQLLRERRRRTPLCLFSSRSPCVSAGDGPCCGDGGASCATVAKDAASVSRAAVSALFISY